VVAGTPLFPDALVDPLGLGPRRRTKPVVVAIRGWCLTIGIELALASDIVVAGPEAMFGQIEINRGIFPFGGATIRMHQRAGWGNAMRWLLTGDTFGAQEALRIGLVQEVAGDPVPVAGTIAATIARRAPLGVQATLRSARAAVERGPDAAAAELLGEARAIMGTEDAAEGMRSFVERRDGVFRGR
jgi:enoyl-CoA hydratase/carnithine racemase